MWQYFLSHSVIPLFFFLTFDGIILPLCSANITYDYNVVTFSDFFYFFLTFYGTIFTLRDTNITCNCIFVTFDGSFFFFLVTFDGIILILWSTNIIYDCNLPHFMVLWFSHFDGTMFALGSTQFLSPDFLLLSLNFSIVHASLFSFISLKFFSSKPSTRTYLEWQLLNKTLSKTHKRRNRSLSHERYLTSSSKEIVLAKQ